MSVEESKQLIRRFYTEVVSGGDYSNLDSFVATDSTGSPHRTLQESMNKGARQSWRLVGVVQDPTSPGGIFLVWDMSGFFSG